MLGAVVVLAQLAAVAHAPDTVAACDAVNVSVAVSSAGGAAPRLEAPSFAPFDVLRRGGPYVRASGTRGGRASVTEWQFVLTTDRLGAFVIPRFEVEADGRREYTRPLPIVVREQRGRSAPTVVTRARIDTGATLNLRAAVAAETVYVGQQATYEVAVFLNQTVRERLRRNPTFYPPEMQAMLAYDLPPTPLASRTQRGGAAGAGGSLCFDALVYRRALFPLVAGRIVIPPAQLTYSTGLSASSLFSREESHELQTDSVRLVAIEPPPQGRPAEYNGAVGAVRIESRFDSLAWRVGDPLLLTLRVTGSGNVKLFPRPALSIPWAALVPADERVRVDSANPRISGIKEFDWVITPRVAGEFDVPPVRYGYFDPGRGAYDVASSPARRVRVAPGGLATADTAQAEGPLPIRTRFAGAAAAPLHTQPAFWVVMALAPLPAFLARARARRAARRARRVVRDPVRSLARSETPRVLRRTFVRVLALRLGCSPEDFTHPGALERALRRAGVSDATAGRAEVLLRDLDTAAYAGVVDVRGDAAEEAVAVARAVDAEALARTELPFWIPMLVAALPLALAATAIAAPPTEADFARGVSAYVRHEFDAARAAFADAVRASPRAPDAWANYGTAAWAAGDTAAAVAGWRQTLALQPTASDARDRLGLVRSEGPTAPGWVPAIPRDALVWLAALLWLGAWAFAWTAQRPGAGALPWSRRLPAPLVACALLASLAAIELEARVSGARLAVVRRAGPLTSEPALGMDRGPTVGTGEIVRVVGRRGTWTRVEAVRDREGWVPSAMLHRLDERRPPSD